MKVVRLILADAVTTWAWHCDRCVQSSLCTFPDEQDAATALRDHQADHCRPVAA